MEQKYFKNNSGGFYIESTKRIGGIVVAISNPRNPKDKEITKEEYFSLANSVTNLKKNFEEKNRNVLQNM